MIRLRGAHILLRALEPEDLDFLYELENNTSVWEVSNTLTPYSRSVLKNYLENAHRDIFEVKQLRLAICTLEGEILGFIDLFDFDPKHQRAGIGIVIAKTENRNKGIGGEALELLCNYAFEILNLHQLYANVMAKNTAGVSLFRNYGFKESGVKVDWIKTPSGFENEIFLQKIK